MHAAAALSGPAHDRAYAALEHDLVKELAPAAAYASQTSIHLFSSRIGCQMNQPIYGIDLARRCVR